MRCPIFHIKMKNPNPSPNWNIRFGLSEFGASVHMGFEKYSLLTEDIHIHNHFIVDEDETEDKEVKS